MYAKPQEESMAGHPTDELQSFHQFLGDKLGGGIQLSPEEALDAWRQLHPDEHELDQECEAIREALVDIANGDTGIPFDEFDRDFRRRHNLPS
jgi:hypothetical protein